MRASEEGESNLLRGGGGISDADTHFAPARIPLGCAASGRGSPSKAAKRYLEARWGYCYDEVA